MTIRLAGAFGALALAVSAAPALAQDSESDSFNGFYVGGSIGYGFQSKDKDERVDFDRDLNGSFDDVVLTSAAVNAFTPGFCNGAATSTGPTTGCTGDDDGLAWSGRIGFDKRMGSVVVGVVGEIGKVDIRDSVTAFSTTPASYTITREIDWNAGLRLRAGVATGSTLFYATGGLAYAKIDNSFTTSNTANAFTQRDGDKSWGFSAGGGVEHMIGSNFSVGVEYLYTRYTQDDYRVRATQGTAPATNPFVLSGAGGTDFRRAADQFDHHAFRATVAFHF